MRRRRQRRRVELFAITCTRPTVAKRSRVGATRFRFIWMLSKRSSSDKFMSVLSHWGVTRCEDVGHMVFNLIGAGIFGKTDEDSMDDFKAVYDFRDAFVKPFQPEPAVTGKKVSLGLPAPKAS